jgi:ABC transport system ATP-binding/permease protein
MVNLINLENVTKSYGVRPILDSVSLGVHASDRIGVLGVNGGGKTTLLEVLSGFVRPDLGRVSRIRSLRTAVVTQRRDLPSDATVREVVLSPLGVTAEHEWAADPQVRAVLGGLDVLELGLDTRVGWLSGGERQRVAIAAALVGDLDVIALDEPTNHLDVEGVRWLADHLRDRRCAAVVVTHDRWFLDAVCTRTWEVVDGRVEQYEGGYADWVFARAERTRQADSAEQSRRNIARKELAWLRRGAPARTSKPRFRIEAAEELIAGVPKPRDSVELLAFARRRLGKTVLELEDVTLDIGQHRLLDGETWRIGPGERIGIVGANGSGKTSLLRLLAGDVGPKSGRRIQGSTVALAHLSQELTELPVDLRVLQAIENVARRVVLGKHELSASQLAERLGFPPSRQWTPVAELSGGERRRLALTMLLMAEPNVLLLDEPTNDLDIDTLQQLEELLDSWAGTLVVVSHDRYLVERVCDTVVALLGDGRITHLPGGIDEYLARRDAMVGAPSIAQAPPVSPASSAASAVVAVAAPPAGLSVSGLQRAARKEQARLERQLDKLATRERQLRQALLDAHGNVDELLRLDAELRDVNAQKSEVEHAWLTAAEEAEPA